MRSCFCPLTVITPCCSQLAWVAAIRDAKAASRCSLRWKRLASHQNVRFAGRPGSLGINYVLHQFTQDLPVKCMSSGCTWSGVYSDAGSHCSVCGKLELKCENDGCLYMSTREEMPQHAAACLKKEIPCPDCKKSVMRELMERHRSLLCFHAMIHCPLDCGTPLPRYDVRILEVLFEKFITVNARISALLQISVSNLLPP